MYGWGTDKSQEPLPETNVHSEHKLSDQESMIEKRLFERALAKFKGGGNLPKAGAAAGLGGPRPAVESEVVNTAQRGLENTEEVTMAERAAQTGAEEKQIEGEANETGLKVEKTDSQDGDYSERLARLLEMAIRLKSILEDERDEPSTKSGVVGPAATAGGGRKKEAMEMSQPTTDEPAGRPAGGDQAFERVGAKVSQEEVPAPEETASLEEVAVLKEAASVEEVAALKEAASVEEVTSHEEMAVLEEVAAPEEIAPEEVAPEEVVSQVEVASPAKTAAPVEAVVQPPREGGTNDLRQVIPLRRPTGSGISGTAREQKEQVLALLLQNPRGIGISGLQRATGIGTRTLLAVLEQLETQGRIKKIGLKYLTLDQTS